METKATRGMTQRKIRTSSTANRVKNMLIWTALGSLTGRSPYCLAVGLSDHCGGFLELGRLFFSAYVDKYSSNKAYIKEPRQVVRLDSVIYAIRAFSATSKSTI